VNRETILNLSGPLADGTTLNTSMLYAEATGRRLLSRVEIAADRRRVSLFYLEPVPSSARVKVTFVGDTIRDVQNQIIDADGDGRPGGVATINFDTASTAFLQGTAVTGRWREF
jgi:hypothetical protein